MKRIDSSLWLLILTTLFWGLTAGFLPYPVIMGLGMGGGPSLVLQAAQQCAPWLVFSALVAGGIGGALSAPLLFGGRLSHLRGLALWVFTSVFASVAGVWSGMAFDRWQRVGTTGQPFLSDALSVSNLLFIGMILAVALVPMGAWGLLTYPVFVRLRRQSPVPAAATDRRPLYRWRVWLLASLSALMLVAAISPRFADDGLSRYQGEKRQAAERASAQAFETLHPLERVLLVQRLRVEGVLYYPTDVGQPQGARYQVSLSAYTVWWVRYAHFNVWYGDGLVKMEGGRLPWSTFWGAAGILAPALGLAGLILVVAGLTRAVRTTNRVPSG